MHVLGFSCSVESTPPPPPHWLFNSEWCLYFSLSLSMPFCCLFHTLITHSSICCFCFTKTHFCHILIVNQTQETTYQVLYIIFATRVNSYDSSCSTCYVSVRGDSTSHFSRLNFCWLSGFRFVIYTTDVGNSRVFCSPRGSLERRRSWNCFRVSSREAEEGPGTDSVVNDCSLGAPSRLFSWRALKVIASRPFG